MTEEKDHHASLAAVDAAGQAVPTSQLPHDAHIHVWVLAQPEPHKWQPRNLRHCKCGAEAFDPPMTDDEYRQRQAHRPWPWQMWWNDLWP